MSAINPIDVNDRMSGPTTATAGQTVFSYDFPIQSEADIAVIRIDGNGHETLLSLGTDFVVSGVGDSAGGSITLSTGAIAGDQYIRAGRVVLQRILSIVRGGRYNSAATDDDLDRAMMISQEHARELDRSWKADYGQTGGRIAKGVAGQVAIFDTDGNVVGAEPGSGGLPGANSVGSPALQSGAVTEPKLAIDVSKLIPNVVLTRTQLKALDNTRYAAALLLENGRQGHFIWNGANQSALLSPQQATSTLVDDTTDIITLGAHPFKTGDAVFINAAANNLAAETFYFIIKNDANSVLLAASYSDAQRGLNIDIVGTANVTLRWHKDPLEGRFVIKAGDPIDGSSGAWVRDQNAYVSNILHFGAKSDESALSSHAIFAAANVLQQGGNLTIPAGRYTVSGNIELPSTDIVIVGDGQSSTSLRWFNDGATTQAGGFKFAATDILNQLRCVGVTFLTDFPGGSTPIIASWPTTLSGQNRTMVVRGCTFEGNGPGYWSQMINAVEAWNCIIEDNILKGGGAGLTNEAIALAGMCGDAQINGNNIISASTAVNVLGNTEGLRVTDNAMLGVNIGVNYAPTTAGRPGTDISGNHISASLVGIRLSEAVQVSATKNLIYKNGNGDFVGIDLASNADNCRVALNEIKYIAGTGAKTGINVGDSANSIIALNDIDGMDTGVGAGATSSGCLITNNNCTNTTTTIGNGGVTNRVYDNWPYQGAEQLPANVTTPSVGGRTGEDVETANTVATVYTDFLDGYIGQEICILANDVNSTVKHGAGIILEGAVDYAMANGAMLTLKRWRSGAGAIWREKARKT